MKLTEDTLKKIAIEYCREGTPLSKLAKKYGVGKTTLVRYFKGEGSFCLSDELQEQVDKKKRQNWEEGKTTRGNLDHTILSKEQAQSLASIMVEKQLTLRDLLVEGGPSISTLYNSFNETNLGTELYKKVLDTYEKNKQQAVDDLKDKGQK